MKKILGLLLITLLLSNSLTAQYKIMLSDNYPPYNYHNEAGELVGFNIDILSAIKDLYDIEIDIASGEWANIMDSLSNKQIDGIAGVHYSGIHDGKYIYTRSVISTSHCFLYNSNHIKKFSLDRLRAINSPLIITWDNDVLTHYVKSINPNAEFIYIKNYQDLMEALDRKDVTCAISQRNAGLYWANKLGKAYIYPTQFDFLDRNMGFKIANESPELAEILSHGLEIILSNGTYAQIYDKWLRTYDDKSNLSQGLYKYLVIPSIILISIIILLVLANKVLKSRVEAKTKDLKHQLDFNSQVLEELKKQKKKAEESDLMKSAFLANMSHEIRTPMNGILGFADLLKDPDFSKNEQDKFINVIQKSGDRMLATINNIIDISKIDAGLEEVRLEEIKINDLMVDLNNFFLPEANKKGINLEFKNTSNNSNRLFVSDSYKLNAILTNLIKNAIKFTDHGSISVDYALNHNALNVIIKDTGIGIPIEKQDLIFNHFVQGESSGNNRYEGSGLGLSISREYASLLNGNLSVESALNKGSKFTLQIPSAMLNKDSGITNESVEPKETQLLLNKLNILIAEDDKSSVDLLKYLLKPFCKKLIHAPNGKEAVKLFEENPDTDIILMDMKMPEMDGFEASRIIRKLNTEVCIIAQTAFAHEGFKEKTLDAGCNHYLTKPINKNKLHSILKAHIAKK